MDIREKLIKLLHVAVCDYNCDECEYSISDEVCIRHLEEMAADHLIANGVMIQEGISQTELPWMGEEIAKLCIRYMEDYADFHCYPSHKKVKAHIIRLLELEKDGRLVILPLPPKGE